jgi:hypothetical protein
MVKQTIYSLRKKLNISYLGGVTHSAKMTYSYNHNVATYCLYLAPADMSGYNTCSNCLHCKHFCLNGSGRNKGDIIAHGFEYSQINRARIKKTKAFFEQKETFMQLLILEIEKAMIDAKNKNMGFAIRLNGTSDISPEEFTYKGQNILEIFSDVQFYDYTKDFRRIALTQKYSNYDVTLSYNGYNQYVCEEYLKRGGKVAVVFFDEKMPKKFLGYNVVDGNTYDMRFLDPNSSVIGLHYHKTGNDYVNGKFVKPTTRFIVFEDDARCEY